MAEITLTHKGRSLDELLVGVLRQDYLPMGPLKNSAAIARLQGVTQEDPDYVDKVMLEIETDFYLAVQSIFQANSHEFSHRAKVENLKQAMVRLGIRSVHNIAMNYDPVVDSSKDNGSWVRWTDWFQTHSVLIAKACYSFARTFRGKNPENCYLVGFFHEIGAVYLLRHLMMEQAEDPDENLVYGSADAQGEEIVSHFQKVGKKFTPLVLRKLRFPEFACYSLSLDDPEDAKTDYITRCLDVAHIFERCFGDLLIPVKAAAGGDGPHRTPAPTNGSGEPGSPKGWSEACLKTTNEIQKKFPDLSMEAAAAEEIAGKIKGSLERLVTYLDFQFTTSLS
ncbi:MAG: HDOD domain-containing protein [Nitrospinota bacterium]